MVHFKIIIKLERKDPQTTQQIAVFSSCHWLKMQTREIAKIVIKNTLKKTDKRSIPWQQSIATVSQFIKCETKKLN